MLVLTGRRGEVITVGDSISFTVVAIADGQVQVGLTAPDCISVHRTNISDCIRAERADAMTDQPTNEASPEERTVRGYKVKVKYRKLSPAEAAAQRAILVGVVARALQKANASAASSRLCSCPSSSPAAVPSH